MNLPSFIYNNIKWQPANVHKGKDLSVSHHCLIRAIIERELIRQGLGTWDDFFKRNLVEPHRGGPRGQGMGTREKTTIGVRKVV